MSFDYALETKLSTESPLLHEILTNNVMSCQNILHKYQSIFPTYTDHTSLHSLEVIAFCNELVGGNIERLNCDEIFVLLMAAYLHDSGMGLSQSDYESFSAQLPAVSAYREKHPNAPIDEIIRLFHHEFSGKFIEKYISRRKNIFLQPSRFQEATEKRICTTKRNILPNWCSKTRTSFICPTSRRCSASPEGESSSGLP